MLTRPGWAAIIAFAMATASPARAGDDEGPIEYLYTDGAVPLFWLPMAGTAALLVFASPPDEPRLFSGDEGGKEHKGDTVPEAAVGAFAVVGLFAVAIPKTDARLVHTKGMAEALATTLFITEVTKNAFGRHRPEYRPGAEDDDLRKSFISGHSSIMFQTTTYLSFFLNQHVFSHFRPEGSAFAWWEAAPYAALAGMGGYVMYTRTQDNRHNTSDVLAGAAVGTAVATAMFWWHEARYERETSDSDTQLSIGPGPGDAGLSVRVSY